MFGKVIATILLSMTPPTPFSSILPPHKDSLSSAATQTFQIQIKIPQIPTNDNNLTALSPSRARQPISAVCLTMAGPQVTSGDLRGPVRSSSGANWCCSRRWDPPTCDHRTHKVSSVLREIQFNGDREQRSHLRERPSTTTNGRRRPICVSRCWSRAWRTARTSAPMRLGVATLKNSVNAHSDNKCCRVLQ